MAAATGSSPVTGACTHSGRAVPRVRPGRTRPPYPITAAARVPRWWLLDGRRERHPVQLRRCARRRLTVLRPRRLHPSAVSHRPTTTTGTGCRVGTATWPVSATPPTTAPCTARTSTPRSSASRQPGAVQAIGSKVPDGGIFTFGDAPFFGSMGGQHLERADGRHHLDVTRSASVTRRRAARPSLRRRSGG